MWDLHKLILEYIVTVKEFVIEQSFCRLIRLELIGLGNFEKWVPPQDADLFPLLQVLIIRDCRRLLELPFSNQIVYPPEQDWNIDWFPKLQEFEIENCGEALSVTPIPWTETLCYVKITDVKLLEQFEYSKSSYGAELEITGKDDLHSLDQVLAFNNRMELEKLRLKKCPPLGLKHLLMLTSLKKLIVNGSDALVGPLGGQGDVEWQIPVEHLRLNNLCGATGRELTELLPHLPRLSKLKIIQCEKITQLVVRVDLQKTTSAASEVEEVEAAAVPAVEQKEEEDGVILFPAHLSDSLRQLGFWGCPELVLVAPPTILPNGHTKTGGGLQALRALQWLTIRRCPKLLSACSFSSPSCHLFPSSLQCLQLSFVKDMGTLEPLSNLTFLTQLEMYYCGEDLRCEGLLPLLTTGGQLSELSVTGSPGFFAGWNPNLRRVLQDEEEEEEQQLQLLSPSQTLQELWTDDVAGLLAAPICSLLSSSLTKLACANLRIKEMECFTKEQEDALHLLASLQELNIRDCDKLQHLPAGLHKLTNLKRLEVLRCPAVRSLPKDGLPKSLQELDVSRCHNEELRQQYRGLVGTIPKINL